jgi:hypothetical protein
VESCSHIDIRWAFQVGAGLENVSVDISTLSSLYHLSLACATVSIICNGASLPPSLHIASAERVKVFGGCGPALQHRAIKRRYNRSGPQAIPKYYAVKLGSKHKLDLHADDLRGPVFLLHVTEETAAL